MVSDPDVTRYTGDNVKTLEEAKKRIIGIADIDNKASSRVLEKVSFRFEKLTTFRGHEVAWYVLDSGSCGTTADRAFWEVSGSAPTPGYLLFSFPRSAWERTPGRSAAPKQTKAMPRCSCARAAERPGRGSHAERGNQKEFTQVTAVHPRAWEPEKIHPSNSCTPQSVGTTKIALTALPI
jgi:hypothetical protein